MAMTPKEMIAVLQHFEAGGKVQFISRRSGSGLGWEDVVYPTWNFYDFEYRIKPNPLELWVNVYNDGHIGCALHDHREAVENCGKGGQTVHMIEVQDD